MRIDYCQQCAAPMQRQTNTDYICDNGHPFWNNPKAAVGVILYKDGQALYAERARDPAKGKFDFPGGFVEYGEHPEAAARRELHEEANITVGKLELVHTLTNIYMPGISTTDILYICREWEGDIVAHDDVASLQWKPIDFILSDDFAWPSYRPVHDILKFSLA